MNFEEHSEPALTEDSISNIAILSALIWLVIAALLLYFFQDSSFIILFLEGSPVLEQTIWGTAAGLILGFAAIMMMRMEMFQSIADEYYILRELKKLKLTKRQILVVSISAGVSEEILFRGAIQPIIGIWFTSILFIAVHGYIRLNTWPKLLFTLFTFLLSMVLGWLFMWFGILSAIIAHAVYDILVLYYLVRDNR